MPWRIEEREDQFCVIKETDNSVEKCHKTRADAEAHQRALYANVGDEDKSASDLIASVQALLSDMVGKSIPDAIRPALTQMSILSTELTRPRLSLREVKATDKGSIVGGYMALWGDPQNRDLQQDYFTPETDFFLEYYSKAPAIFHHGQDQLVGKSPIGYRDDAFKKDDGLWIQDWLDKSGRYWHVIAALLDAGKLYYSPGAVPQLVDRAPDRQLKAYPIVDDTLTPIPAQFALGLRERSLDYVKSAYTEAGLEFGVPESLRGKLGNGLTSDSAQQAQALARLKLKKASLLTY